MSRSQLTPACRVAGGAPLGRREQSGPPRASALGGPAPPGLAATAASSHRCTCPSSPSSAASCWPPSLSCPSTCGGWSAPLRPHCASRFRTFSPKRYWDTVQGAPAVSGVGGWRLSKQPGNNFFSVGTKTSCRLSAAFLLFCFINSFIIII